MPEQMSLLCEGASAVVVGLTGDSDMHKRLMDLGLTPGTKVTCVQRSPLGDPTAYLIRGAMIALRTEDAALVRVAAMPCGEASDGAVKSDGVIALAGNPNVGKSTVFNALTRLRQHTGNWAGKTVCCARGRCRFQSRVYEIVDLPGCYSLHTRSAEEEVARDFIRSGKPDVVVVVCDAGCLERNLILALQILSLTPRVVLCVNLMDEAEKKGISVDIPALSRRLGIPVVPTAARSRKGLDALMTEAVRRMRDAPDDSAPPHPAAADADPFDAAVQLAEKAEAICRETVTFHKGDHHAKDRRWDRLFTGRLTAFPVMLVALTVVFWITLYGANYPSQGLARLLLGGEPLLAAFLRGLGVPGFINGMLTEGMYRVLAWVVSVMLPPMAIFFPLFTLLEDVGYLPRVAFNLDKLYKGCHACGKQALTMCMGFGCNAAGVTGCRIIDSPRERLIAIITNGFVPCNGRFPPPPQGQLYAASLFNSVRALS